MKAIIIGIVALAVIAGGAFALTRKSSNTNTNTTTPNNTSSETPSTSSGNQTQASGGEIITTKTDASVGQYLADGSGKTLYTYGKDASGVSNCSGSCLAAWPIYEASDGATLPANVTIITRSNGKKQYAYKGMPLYYFTSDSVGKVTGDGVALFHVAKP